MLNTLTVEKEFIAVPYLPTTALLATHKRKLTFSTDKPNVLVGSNGTGKSALLKTLTLRFLAYCTGSSALDDYYVSGNGADDFWYLRHSWMDDPQYLKGLECDTDGGPVRYYRPGHIPGNEKSITHAMMMGYSEEGFAYGKLTEKKSSGQKSMAVLSPLLATLSGEGLPDGYDFVNWRHGKVPRELNRHRGSGTYEYRAEALRRVAQMDKGARPLILMDEPEQSLDARAEAQLWASIAAADCSKMQVIVATHSLYPLLHPERFNIIETEKGFANEVISLTM